MTYGTIKVDTVTFTDAGVDKSVTLSGLVQNPTFSGNVTVTGTLSGVTVTGTTANFTSGNFTNISGGTHTIASGVFAAGSAASPSITFTGDLNTGIYSPGADQVAISTNGTGRLFVDASGNIGLGITPVANTLLGGARGSSLPGLIELAGNGNTVGSSGFAIGQDGSGVATLFQRANAAMYFATNGSERLRITSAGLVGVGTSSPSSIFHARLPGTTSATIATFDRSDGAVASEIHYDGSDGRITFGTTTNHPLSFETNNTRAVTIDTSQRVGIGTSSPTATLDVNGSAQVTGSVSGFGGGEIRLGPTTANTQSAITTQATGAPALIFDHRGTSNTGTFAWRNGTGGANALMTLDGSGRLGIGTTNLSTTFTAYGGNTGIELDTALGFSNRANTGTVRAYDRAGSAYRDLGITGANILFGISDTERARIDSSGRLLVGTSTIRDAGNASQSTRSPLYFIEGAGGSAFSLFTGILGRADENGPNFTFAKTRSNSIGANTIVQNGDSLGSISFAGADGTDLNSVGAIITAQVDGTPGVDDMPGRLVFSTTADGASSPTERLRIDSSGRVGIGTSSPATTLDVDGTITARGSLIFKDANNSNTYGLRALSGIITADSGANWPTGWNFQYGNTSNSALYIDSSGRVGIGNTTAGSYNAGFNQLVVGSSGDQGVTIVSGTSNSGTLAFADGTSGADAYRGYVQYQHGSTNALVFATDGSERFRCDSSGRLLVGTSSYSGNGKVAVAGNTGGNAGALDICWAGSRPTTAGTDIGYIRWYSADNSSSNAHYASIYATSDGDSSSGSDIPGRLVFSTTADGASSPTERMRITQAGGVKVSTNGSYAILGSVSSHEFVQSNQGVAAFHAYHSASSGIPYGFYFKFTNLNPNDTTSYVFTSVDNTNANIYTINSNGTVTARSDAKFKKNIETTRNGYLEDLAQLRVVKYNWYNHEDNTPKELGFIAQEVEQVFPGLVSTAPDKDDQGNETGEVSKSIKTSVFTPMLVKALQEALKRIETLEAEVAALKAL